MNTALNLFVKSSGFAYTAKLVKLASGFLYVYLIANFLGPEQYGIITYLLSFAGLIALWLGTDAISETINVFTAQTRSKAIFSSLAKLQLLVVVIIAGLFFIAAPFFVIITGKGSIELVQWTSLIILATPFSFLFNSLFGGLKQFGKVLKLTALESIVNLVLSYIFVFWFSSGLLGIIFGKIVSLTVTALMAFFYFKSEAFSETSSEFSDVKKYLKNSLAFNFLKKAHTQTITILLGVLVQPSALGLYYLIDKLSTAVIEMPLNSIAEVMLPFASEKHINTKTLENYVSLSLRFSLMIALIFSIILLLLGNIVVQLFFPRFIDSIQLIPFFTAIYFLTSFRNLGIPFKTLNKVHVLTQSYGVAWAATIITGIVLVPEFGLQGILTTIIISNSVLFGYQYLNLHQVNVKISLIPIREDWTIYKKLITAGIQKIK